MKLREKQTLKDKALKNSTVAFKGQGTKEYTTTKQGVPLDNPAKLHGVSNSLMFGMCKGVTKNMGDYESLRVDVWLTDSLQPDETVQEGFKRLSEVVDEVLEEIVLAEVD